MNVPVAKILRIPVDVCKKTGPRKNGEFLGERKGVLISFSGLLSIYHIIQWSDRIVETYSLILNCFKSSKRSNSQEFAKMPSSIIQNQKSRMFVPSGKRGDENSN